MNRLVDVPHGEVEAAVFKLGQALGEHGRRVIQRINSELSFVAELARFAIDGGNEPPTNQFRAREIMGKNMIGPDDAIKHFGIPFNKQQLTFLHRIPFSEEVLIACKDTHVLVAVFPMSILDIRSKVAEAKLSTGQKSLFYRQDWYDYQTFAKAKGELGWHLIRKVLVDNSTSKTWDEQQALLGKDEETPTAQVMVYTIIAYFLATDERLFDGFYVRCSDLDLDGRRVFVSGLDTGGLEVFSCWDLDRDGDIGVSSALMRALFLNS